METDDLRFIWSNRGFGQNKILPGPYIIYFLIEKCPQPAFSIIGLGRREMN